MPEPSTVTRLRALGPRAPRLRFGLAWPRIRASDYRRVFPFQRHRPAIALSAVILAVFAFPLFNLPRGSLTQSHDLSALTGVLFVWYWTLGWSVGVGLIALVFLALAS